MANAAGYAGIAVCRGCAWLSNTFYFQAEVLPVTNTDIGGGLAFCIQNSDDYYVFYYLASNGAYSLFKHTSSGWQEIVTATASNGINNNHDANILGVYFDKGNIKLYINGSLVDTVNDAHPLTGGNFGIFINDGGVDQAADNVFVYQVDATPTPIP